MRWFGGERLDLGGHGLTGVMLLARHVPETVSHWKRRHGVPVGGSLLDEVPVVFQEVGLEVQWSFKVELLVYKR